MTARRLEIFVIVTIIAVIGIVYAFTQKPALAPVSVDQNQDQLPSGGLSVRPDPNNPTPTPPPVSTATIEYNGQDGKNALDLLKATHQVDAKSYSFGSYVSSIDGVTPDSSHFWAFYVNDQFSQIAADQYITKSSDRLRWEIDAVVNTK